MSIFNTIKNRLASFLHRDEFRGSSKYWEERYKEGGNSGRGSYGKLAEFKAEVLNDFVEKKDVKSVIEFGCGDGAQLELMKYPKYVGVDISKTIVKLCEEKFQNDLNKKFVHLESFGGEKYDLAMSLDVIYHLVEDKIFQSHIDAVFSSADRFVIIYSSNIDDTRQPHVRHRVFTDYVEKNFTEWQLVETIPNKFPEEKYGGEGSLADFFVFARTTS